MSTKNLSRSRTRRLSLSYQADNLLHITNAFKPCDLFNHLVNIPFGNRFCREGSAVSELLNKILPTHGILRMSVDQGNTLRVCPAAFSLYFNYCGQHRFGIALELRIIPGCHLSGKTEENRFSDAVRGKISNLDPPTSNSNGYGKRYKLLNLASGGVNGFRLTSSGS